MRKRYYWPFFVVSILSACSDHQKQADKLLQVSAESLSVAASMKAQQLELVEARITEMAETPYLSQIAAPWEQRIKRIAAFTELAYDQLKKLRRQLKKEYDESKEKKIISRNWSGQAGSLYTQLIQFRDSVLDVYPMIRAEFGRSLPLFGTGLDSVIHSGGDISEMLRSASYPAAFSFLSNVEFNIITAGWKCATFCLESISYHNGCDSGPNLIIAQNPQVVLPGASITVGFGVGIFPYGNRYKMEVAVNNGPFKPLENGIENIRVKAERIAGHYKVPLVIRYLDQDGKRQEMKKLIEYMVVDTLGEIR